MSKIKVKCCRLDLKSSVHLYFGEFIGNLIPMRIILLTTSITYNDGLPIFMICTYVPDVPLFFHLNISTKCRYNKLEFICLLNKKQSPNNRINREQLNCFIKHLSVKICSICFISNNI